MKLWKRVRMWRDRRRFEQDLAEEIRIHREMSGAAAFGSEALALEQSRDVWGFTWLESWKQDVRYAVRGLRRSPGFTLAVVGAVALGIGLNTTMFTVFNAYVLRPYAVRDPYSLYSFTWYGKDGAGHWFSTREYERLRNERGIFTDVVAYDNFGANVSGRNLFAQLVTPNYFDMLGVGMELGRPLLEGDRNAAVMGYQAWVNHFGGDPGIVGRRIYLRGQTFQVVGIASRRFTGVEGMPIGVWLPMSMRGAVKDAPPEEGLRLIGRVRPGLGESGAKAGLMRFARVVWPDAVGIAMTLRATSVPLTRDAWLTFTPIFLAFGMVLLIACANVSNMMLARALARQREIAIRVSLGAGRARLVRQLLTESALLAVPAAVLGFLLSEATIEGARRLLFATVPPAFSRLLAVEDLTPDWRVFAYILGASLATALIFGLAPAIQCTRARLVEANRGDFSTDYRPARLRNLLVVAQVGVCALLLILTFVVLRSERRVSARENGFDIAGVWDVRMIARYQQAAADRLSATPGVEAVALAWRAPLYGSPRRIAVTPSGRSESFGAGHNFVSPNYFSLFRIPIVAGRTFTEADADADAPLVIVSEAAARRFWPGRSPVGEMLQVPPGQNTAFARWPSFATARVIGVAKDVSVGWVTDAPDETMLYFPDSFRAKDNDSLLVRMAGNPAGREKLEAALAGIGPSIADQLNPLEDVLALQLYPFRVTFWVAGFLGGVALLLTVSGIFGVMSYVVSQRTKEIGIRVALGAGRPAIVAMVLRQTSKLAGAGVAGGIGLALLIAPIFAHQIDAIRPFELIPYAAVAVILMVAAVGASYAPSRRAVRIDPIVTLRCD